jgi:precorrin-8X/cobalt-precorrin-8 methylmutase
LIELKKALLIIDRGSREQEVRTELQDICSMTKYKGGYHYTDYCFLEVLPPFIEEGIKKCLDNNIDYITVMPYFLYPGMKLKESVKQTAKIGHGSNLKIVITKPLSYHSIMTNIIIERINNLKNEKKIQYYNSECDILVIGHGSSDRRARDAFIYTVNTLKPNYRNVDFCFLELDYPNIGQGIKSLLQKKPKIIILMPYFLHKGAHVKRDIINDVNIALETYGFKNAFMTKHLGVDERMVDIILERAKEAEEKRNGFL